MRKPWGQGQGGDQASPASLSNSACLPSANCQALGFLKPIRSCPCSSEAEHVGDVDLMSHDPAGPIYSAGSLANGPQSPWKQAPCPWGTGGLVPSSSPGRWVLAALHLGARRSWSGPRCPRPPPWTPRSLLLFSSGTQPIFPASPASPKPESHRAVCHSSCTNAQLCTRIPSSPHPCKHLRCFASSVTAVR